MTKWKIMCNARKWPLCLLINSKNKYFIFLCVFFFVSIFTFVIITMSLRNFKQSTMPHTAYFCFALFRVDQKKRGFKSPNNLLFVQKGWACGIIKISHIFGVFLKLFVIPNDGFEGYRKWSEWFVVWLRTYYGGTRCPSSFAMSIIRVEQEKKLCISKLAM